MQRNKASLEVAIRIAEKIMAEIDERYNSFKQKVSSYVMILAILVALFSLFLQSLIKPDSPLVIFLNNLTSACTVQTILFIITALLFLCTFVFTIGAVVVIIRSLIPITLQAIDTESVEEASKGKILDALEIYLKDIQSTIKYNDESVRNRISDIFSINWWLIGFVIFYFLLPIAYFFFVLSLS